MSGHTGRMAMVMSLEEFVEAIVADRRTVNGGAVGALSSGPCLKLVDGWLS